MAGFSQAFGDCPRVRMENHDAAWQLTTMSVHTFRPKTASNLLSFKYW